MTQPVPLASDASQRAVQHARLGWWLLLLFLSLGLILEGLHGFKVRWYLDVSNELRRLMLTLAHAHGTLLALVHIAFAFTLRSWPDRSANFWAAAANSWSPGSFATAS